MAGTVSLGAIQAEIGLDLLGLRSGVGDAKRILQDFGADVSASVTQIGSQMSAGLERSIQESLAKTARQMSQGMKATVQQAKESIFAMTHESGESQRLKILSRYERDVAGGTPSDMAAQRRDLSLSALEERERLSLQKMSDMRSKLGMNSFDREKLTAQRDWERAFRESSDPSMRGEASLLFQDRMEDILARQREQANRSLAPSMARMDSALGQGFGAIFNPFNEGNRQQALSLVSGGLGEMYDAQQQQKAREEASEKEQSEIEKVRKFEYRTGQLSLEEYRGFLGERLRSLQEYSPEWRRVYEQMYRLDGESQKKLEGQFRQQGRDGADSMAQGVNVGSPLVRNALSALTDASLSVMGRSLQKGVKGVFGQVIVHTLTNLLADVLDNAIASIFRKKRQPTEKKGFLGGLLGTAFNFVGGFFGFDDAANDGQAKGWGWDFAKHFSRGIDSYQGRMGVASSAPSSGASSYNVTVHLNYTGSGKEADYREIGRQLAWETAKALKRSR